MDRLVGGVVWRNFPAIDEELVNERSQCVLLLEDGRAARGVFYEM